MSLIRPRSVFVRILTLSLLCAFPLHAQWTNGQDAAYVLGQTNFTSAAAGTTQQAFSAQAGLAIDALNNKLYVCDAGNNRVLRFALPITSNNPSAEIVFGQANFTSSGTGTTQNTLNNPRAAAVDAAGNLYVVDNGNNRILRYDAAHAIAINQPNANYVYGQSNFTSSAAATSQAGLDNPFTIAVSSLTGDVFVSDLTNRRVVRYPAASLTTNGPNANLVLGAPNYVTVGSASAAQNSLPNAFGVVVVGTTLYVANASVNRVVAFDNIGSKVNGDNADRVLGQTNFTASAAALTATGMGGPTRFATDGTNLFVGDGLAASYNRVLIFNNANAKASGAAADNVLGQSDFTTSGVNLTQRGMNNPIGLAYTGSVLFVTDQNHNRVLVFAQSGMNVQNNYPPFGIPPITPTFNTMTASPTTNIVIPFTQNVASVTVNATNFRVSGTMRGRRTASYGVATNTATLSGIISSFLPNEQVWVSVTNAQSTGGSPTRPFVMGFRTGVTTGPGLNPATFYQTSVQTGGLASSNGLTCGDVNGNGTMDLISVNQGSPSTISVFLNAGAGAFAAGVTYNVTGTANARAICSGDFDNDGDIDVAVSDDNGNVAYMQNNGAGVFAVGPVLNLAAGAVTLRGIAAGDFDADGDLDLAVSRQNGGLVYIALNNGSGTFSAGGSIAVGTNPTGISTGDIDNDGDVDVVVANSGGSTVSVLTNNGIASFVASSLTVGTGPADVQLGDIDNDNDLDIVTCNMGTDDVSILRNSGGGSFAGAINVGVNADPLYLVLGDWDGDGDLDIAASSYLGAPAFLSIVENTGVNTGTFAFLRSALAGNHPRPITAGDWDGDGDLDLATINEFANNMSILLNTVFPTVSSVSPTQNLNNTAVAANILPTFTQNMSVASAAATRIRVWRGQKGYISGAGAFSGGGTATITFNPTASFTVGERVSVTVSTNATNTIGFGVPLAKPFVWQFNTAVTTGPGLNPGTFPNGTPGSPYASGAGSYSVELGDFLDNDGDLDMAVANYAGNSVLIYRNNPTGTFSLFQTLSAGFHTRDVTLGDFNNDGWLDIATANIDANSVSVFISAAGTLPGTATQTLTTSNKPSGIAVGDVNGDGFLDIITANTNAGAAGDISVFLNNGTGTFPLTGINYATSGNGSQELAIGDMDNDGDLDVVTANANSNTVSVMQNNGLGVFSVFGAPVGVSGTTPTAIALTDLNNDGNLDVFTANNGSSNVSQLRGNGTGALAFWAAYTVSASPHGLAIGDVNGASGPDIVVTNFASNTIDVLPGDGFGGFFAGATWSQGTPAVNGWTASLGDVDGDGDLDVAVSSDGVAVLRNMAVMNVQSNSSPFTAGVPVVPARNVNNAALNTTITIPFSQNLNGASVVAANFRVHGTMGGRRTAAPSFATNTVTLAASTPNFLRGEQVFVTVTNAQSIAPDLALTRPFVYGFRAAAAGTGTGNFVDARRYPTGTQPLSTVAGQFDNSAGVDFAVANLGTGTVTIYRNDGTGNFPSATNIVTVTVGTLPYGLETGDFDNDGDTDIIVVCQGSVWLVQNNNNGTYTPSSVITSTYARVFAAVTDFNADGNLDIVFGNNCCAGTPGAQVYLGNGMPSPTFTLSHTFTSPASDYIIPKVADMDGDGDMDIVYSFAGGSGGIRVYDNDGTGKFVTSTLVLTGVSIFNLQVGDLNGDARPDIVYTTVSGATQDVNIMLRTAPFTAYNFTTTSLAIPSAVSPHTHLADIDADGDLDILAVRSASTTGLQNAVFTLQNSNAMPGTFSITATSPLVGFSGNHISVSLFAVAAADFDNDGDLDLAIPKFADNQVAVVLNQSPALLVTGTTPAMNASNVAPTATITPTYNLAVTAATHSLTGPIRVYGSQSAGRNRTGGGSWAGSTFTPNNIPTLTRAYFPGEKVDIVISSAANVGVGLTPLQQGTVRQFTVQVPTVTPGTFVQLASYPTANTGQACAMADFDSDGNLDVVTANQAGGNSSVFFGAGGGTMGTQTPYSAGTSPPRISIADFNNDGKPDYAIANSGASFVTVCIKGAGLTFTPTNIAVGGNNGVISTADFNGDGNIDIIVELTTAMLQYLQGNGDGTFQAAVNLVTLAAAGHIAAGDFNGDGAVDIVAANPGANQLQILLGSGLGTSFTALTAFSVGGTTPHTLDVADYDGDGNVDIAVTLLGSNAVAIHRGVGNGTFLAADVYSTGAGTAPRTLATGDFNGDGRMDIAAASFGNNSLCVLLRNPAVYAAGSAFATVVQYPTPFTNPHGIAAGDVDNDGDIDLVMNYNGAAQMTVFLNAVPFNVQNNGPTTFTPPLTTPAFNTMNAALTTDINIPFSANLNAGTVIAPNFRVHGTLRGMRSATYGVAPANTATLTGITSSFLPNERVWVSVTNAQSTGGASTRPFVMGFRAASGLTPGAFYQTNAVSSAGAKRVVYGHFNADAFIDMAVAGSGGIELFTGAATGVFTSAGMIAGSGGTSYYALATADMDNDNDLDIIGGYNDNTRTVRVFTNNGAAVFTALAPLAGIGVAANNINDLAVADFNADGLMDVAATCGGAVANGNYAVLRNTGGGILAVQQTASSPNIYGVDVGDIDGDGDIDIAYTRWSAGEIFTLINDGRGNFYAGQTLVFGTDARSVRLGDVNNDGRLDLVVVQGGPSNLRIFLNSGTATTYPGTASQTVAFGAWATDVQLFDADGDSFLDAVATEDVGGRLVFFKNNAGTFAAPTSIYGFPNLLYLAAADIDNDGDIDLAASANNNSVHILKYGLQPLETTVAPFRNGNNVGNNPNVAAVGAAVTVNFSANITTNTYSVPPAQQLFQVHGGFTGSRTRMQGLSPYGVYSGGAASATFTPSANFRPGELVSVSVTNASSSVTAPNNSVGIRTRPYVFDFRVAAGFGPATFIQGTTPAVGGAPYASYTADLNGDGILDIVVTNFNTNNISVLLGTGGGVFGAATNYAVGTNPYGVAVADFNNDGLMDIAVANNGSNNVSVLLGTGGGAFGGIVNFGVAAQPTGIVAADVNGDGFLDIAAATFTGASASVLLGTGTGTFGTVANYPLPAGGANGIACGDVNGDGAIDMVTANLSNNSISVLLGTGLGLFQPSVEYVVGTTPHTPVLADFDNDGDLDAAVTNFGGTPGVSVLLNNGPGTFAPSTFYSAGASASLRLIVAGDWNGDGNIDLAYADKGTVSRIGVMLGTGTGTFGAIANYLTNPGVDPHGICAGDFDGDGDLDIASANNISNTVSVMFNTSLPTVFYYRSGDAGLPANWFSTPNPTGGTAASSFSSPATDFYIMGGMATTTATVNTSFTLGPNVSLHVTTPSVLAVANGVTITNNGFLNVSGSTLQTSTLRLTGTGAVTGLPVKYWSTNATLEYQPTAPRWATDIEFPVSMYGSVLINGAPPGQVVLNSSKTIEGTTTLLGGNFSTSNMVLTLTHNGSFVNAGGNMDIGSNTTMVFNSRVVNPWNVNPAINTFPNLTVNLVPGATLTLGSPITITNTLTLTQGYIRTTATNLLSVTNAAPAGISGGSANSHITGPLQRSITAGANTYPYPVGGGTASMYLPTSLNYASAAATSVVIEAAATASGGSEVLPMQTGSISGTEFWRVNPNGAVNTATITFQRSTPSLIAGAGGSILGTSTTQGGIYTGAASTVTPPLINITASQNLTAGDLFYAIGSSVGPPQISALSPTRNNPSAGTYPFVAPIQVTFSQTLTALGMRTFGSMRGRNTSLPTGVGMLVGTQGGNNFMPGERVMTTVMTSTMSASGSLAAPHVYEFIAAAASGTAILPRTNAVSLGVLSFYATAVADVDKDGNLDGIIMEETIGAGKIHVARGNGTGGFLAPVAYNLAGAAQQGRFVTTGDFNNDGWIDIVAANTGPGAGSINIFINNGSGGYGVPVQVGTAQGIISVMTADFNGDGNLDIAVTNFFAGGQVNIYQGNGVGGFALLYNGVIGGSPNPACAGDFDNDGDIDLFVFNNNGNRYTLLNNGNGSSFTVTSVAGSGATPKVFDMDGDGDMDIVYEGGPTNVAILENDGTGNFPTTHNIVSGLAGPYGLTVGNFDNDPRPDIFCNDATNYMVLRNTGGWVFTQSAIGSPEGVGACSPGDFDNDGDLDIFALGAAGGVLLKNGNQPAFTTLAPVRNSNTAALAASISPTSTQIMTTATASANALKVWGGLSGLKAGAYSGGGTATPTLAPTIPFRPGEQVWVTVTNAQSSAVGSVGIVARPLVYGFRAQAGVGPAQFQQVSTSAVATGPRFVASGDFDGDGDIDLATANSSGNNISIFMNLGGGVYAPAVNYGAGTNTQCVMPGDFNNDGFIDLAVANDGSNNVSILLNNNGSPGTFFPAVNYGVGTLPQAVTVGDFDGDGDLDIATANLGTSNVSILLNTGAGAFAPAVNYGAGTNPEFITTGDFDNDGDLDLATANYGSNNVSILLNTGAGAYAPAVNYGVGTQPNSIATGDFDGDGDMDIVAANIGGNNLSVLINIGAGVYAAAVTYPVGTAPASVATGDFDGDGDLDLATANTGDNTVSVLLNAGAGTFGAAVSYAAANQPFSVATGDFDGDGDLDLATANFASSDVSVLFNQNAPTRAGFGNARTFNGTPQYVERATMPAAAIGTGDFTVEAWIRTANSAATPPVAPFFSIGNAGVANDGLHIYSQGSSGRLQVSTSLVWGPSANIGVITEDNQWHHIAVVKSGTTITFYVDGIQSGSGAVPGGMNIATGYLRIGGLVPVGSDYYDGDIDEVRFWNVALPQSTINFYKGLEISGVGVPPLRHPNWTNLIGYWKLNEYSGSAADASGNGHILTPTGAPTVIQSFVPVSIIAEPALGSTTTATLPATTSIPPATFSLAPGAMPLLGNPSPNLGSISSALSTLTYSNNTGIIAPNVTSTFGYRAAGSGTNDDASVTIRYRPRITATPQFVVPNTNAVLNPPTVNGGTGTLSYLWSGSPYLVAPFNVPNPIINTPNTQLLTVTVSDSYGFSETVVGAVNVTIVSGDYYYTSGDAADPSNWKSNYGTGMSAPNFLTAGTRFYVMGSTSGISTTVATILTNGPMPPLTLGAGVEMIVASPSTLAIGDGVTFTNNGTLTIQGNASTGATLQLNGGGSAFVGTAPVYQSVQSRLRYTAPNAIRSTSILEFPPTMGATVVVDAGMIVELDGNKILNGGLVLDGNLRMHGRTVDLNGALSMQGGFEADNGSILRVQGNAPVVGALKIATNFLGQLVMDRGNGVSIRAGSPMLLQNLAMLRGVLQTDTTNMVIMSNILANAVSGGSDSSYIEGPMQRYLPGSLSGVGTGTWLFPVGKAGRYLPFSLIDPNTGGNGPLLQAEAYTGNAGGSADSTLGSGFATLGMGEHWDVKRVSGDFVSSRVLIRRLPAPPLGAVMAKSPTKTGIYTNIGGTKNNTELLSNTFTGLSTFTLAQPGTAPITVPQISLLDFQPRIGTSGNVIRVTGGNLNFVSGVSVGGVGLGFTIVTSNLIVAQLDTNARSGALYLGSAVNGNILSPGEFTFVPRPDIQSFTPQNVGVNADMIIKGANFVPTPLPDNLFHPMYVRIGTVFGSILSYSPTQMTVRFSTATQGNITLGAWGGATTVATITARVIPAPTVNPPRQDTVAAGETITLTGTNLGPTVVVTIGGVPVPTLTSSTTGEITFVVPPGAPNGVIVITTPGGTVTTGTVVIPPPVITSVNPASVGYTGDEVVLRGTGFINVSEVHFGGIAATFVSDEATQTIRAIVPAGASTGTISVRARGGIARAMQVFTVLPPLGPTITGFEPVPAVEGQPIIIRGVNFPTNTTITIVLGGTTVTVRVTDPTRIDLIVPTGTVPLTEFQTNATIRLLTPTGTTTASVPLPVSAPNTPRITNIETTVNDDGTGATVRITGQNFDTPPRGTVTGITIGGIPITEYRVISPTEIIAILSTPTVATVRVSTPVGTFTSTATVRFTDPNGQVSAADSSALRRLYQTLGGNGWTTRTNWLDPRRGVQTWYGVSVENGRVVALTLPANNLAGVVTTTAFVGLDSLKVLNLSGNVVQGEVLKAVARLKKLKELKLSNMNLTLGIEELCSLREVTTLDLSRNALQGDIGSIFCCLPKAERVNLSHNLLTGVFPYCMTAMQNLQVLDISYNRLQDTLPWWLASVGRLEALNLRNNQLRGVLPEAWGTTFAAVAGVQSKQSSSVHAMTETLTTLNLGVNRFTGGIPASFGNFRVLKTLALDSNRLQGAVPEELVSLRQARTIVLSANEFTELPPFASISRLDTLRVERNALEFGPLERNRMMVEPVTNTAPTRLWYAPQAEIGVARRVTVTLDSALTLQQVVSGTSNRYEWRVTDADGGVTSMGAPSATSATLVFAALKATQAGVYRCYITNPDFPALTLVSRPVTVETRLPSRPPETPVLLSPEWQEEDIFVRPVLEWRTVAGAAVYETEIATDSLFKTIVQRFSTQQTEQGLKAQTTRQRAATLDALQRHYWRVRAENAAGRSDWSNWSVFVTAPSNVSFEVQRVNFGDVARLDTTQRTMILRNASNSAAILRSLTLQRGTTGPDISLDLPTPDLLVQAGDTVVLSARFSPQTLGLQTANITITYSTVGTTDILRNEYANKLTGRGAMLKIIVPDFDTVVVGKTRVASVLFINRGFTNAEVRSIRLTNQSGSEYSLVNANGASVTSLSGLSIPVLDTASVLLRLTPRTVGLLAANSIRYAANVDSSEGRLIAFGRDLSPNDLVVKMGVRAVPDSVAPGGATTLELYIATRQTGFIPNERVPNLRELIARVVPRISGAISYNRNVLSLKSGAQEARRLRNTSPTNTQETIILPPTGWDGKDSVILRIPCVAVAGEIDTTAVRISALDWDGVVLDAPTDGHFVAKACVAGGGKRLVTSAKAVNLSLVAPNPAKDMVQVNYTVREDGFVRLELVDVHGKTAQVLVAEEQSAGEYSINAMVKNLPSGAYTVRLQTSGIVKTQRLDVVR